VAAHFGYESTNNVRQHLRLIKRKGYIRFIPGKARGIEIVVGLEKDTGKNSIDVALIGSVAAGIPINFIIDTQPDSYSRFSK